MQRILDDDYHGGSRVSFEDWNWDSTYQKMAASEVAQAIENTLQDFPPDLHVQPNEDNNDLTVTICIGGLGNGDDGPTWQCSLGEELLGNLDDYSEEDKVAVLESLLALAEFARSKLGTVEVPSGPRVNQ